MEIIVEAKRVEPRCYSLVMNSFCELEPDYVKHCTEVVGTEMNWKRVEPRCYSLVMNSFCELESDYVKHCTEVVGRRTWHLGPVSLCNGNTDKKAARGNDTSNEYRKILYWLDNMSPGSVVYVCFGRGCNFSAGQLREIALGLEAADRPFVWVVRQNNESWTPGGYEKRMEGKGLIVRGWAPQILILNHVAVCGFVTHCGWNSTLEAVSAGVPLVSWPQFAEQFFNERMVVDVLKIGVAVGVRSMVAKHEERELVATGRIDAVLRQVIDGGEDEEDRRRRARELGSMARKAVEDGSWRSRAADPHRRCHPLPVAREPPATSSSS